MRHGTRVLAGLAAVGAAALLTAAPAAAQARGPAAGLAPEVMEYVAVSAPVVALTHVRVVDGTGAPPREDQTIVIRDGRIAEVGPAASVRVPAGAEVRELRGHTVIPGMVGMHNHTFYTTSGRTVQLSYSAPRLYLASGLTTVRTTGSYHPYSEINMKRAIEAGEEVGPRLLITGPYLTGTGGAGMMTQVGTPEDARRSVAYWTEEGVDWFKAYTRITRAELGAAIDEAHRRGKKFTGHLCSVSFTEAVELGIDNLEHGFFTNSDYSKTKRPDECPQDLRQSLLDVDLNGPEVQRTFRTMIENDVPMTSTLAVYELSVPGRPPMDKLERDLDVLAPEVREEYLATRQAIGARNDGRSAEVFRKAQQYEKKFVEAGGLLAAGVDPTGIGGALPGFGDQRNFELLVEAGFTPVEVVQIMSLNGAKVLGMDREIGSIEAGKLADLAVIDGNPIEDPDEIRDVELVFKGGVGYDAEKLIESVRGVVGVR